MENTLSELGDEYMEGAGNLELLIKKYIAKVLEAVRAGDYAAELAGRRMLSLYYRERNDALDTAVHLKNYYRI